MVHHSRPPTADIPAPQGHEGVAPPLSADPLYCRIIQRADTAADKFIDQQRIMYYARKSNLSRLSSDFPQMGHLD